MKNKLVTTAIDYVNGAPHLGHALEKIYADVYARHLRKKHAVYFLTGTDENSLKNVRAAEKAGVSTEEFVLKNSLKFQELKTALNLSYNDFIRTTEERHVKGVQKLWKLAKKDIYKKNYKGLYCVSCEEYYKEDDLKCPIHKTELEEIEEENYFFKLSKYQDKILDLIEKDEVQIIPQARKNEILNFIKSGLQDFCISRTSERAKGWGIDVPNDPNQKIWVWFDALANYMTALSKEDFDKFWINGDVIHIIGKDIVRFHAVYFIGILLALNFKLPKKIVTHGFITVDGEKMSKTISNVIDPFDLVLRYGRDPLRYFLLSEFKTTADGDFSYEKFEKKYHADLSSGLGNLVSRILTMIEKKDLKGSTIVVDFSFKEEIKKYVLKYEKHLNDFEFNESINIIWEMQRFLDKYIEEKKPWEVTDRKELVLIFSKLVYALRKIALMLDVFLPETSEKILSFLGEDESKIDVIKKEMLFPRLNEYG
ncbi:MAG: methionine--tRNA ligase [Candidatus Paceibacterota bacterium]